MSLTTDLLEGVATYLSNASVAVYDADRVWTQTDTEAAVVFSLLPQAPDRVIVLTDYPVSDDVAQSFGTVGVQVRCRGLPGQPQDVQSLRDAVYTQLQGLVNQTWGSVHAIQVYRRSSIPNGQDDSQRFEYFDNYYIDVDLPVTANRPF